MCGILATRGPAPLDRRRRLLNRMAHRGPDGHGGVDTGGAWLGHRRLAIMDPAGGAQPIFAEDGKTAIVCNGEIYNFPALRKELEPRHRFRTKSDTEVVLHLWEEQGTAGLHRLEGMYAIVIAGPGTFVAARDPVGIKPLYTAEAGSTLWLASEIEPLQRLPGSGIVKPLAPGHFIEGGAAPVPFRTIPAPAPGNRSPEAEISRIRKSLESAVESHLMSDVEVGSFLSGGIDSGIISALVRRLNPRLRTFSVGLEGSQDVPAARATAKALQTRHTEYMLREDRILEALPDIVAALESWDRDLVRSAIPCWFVSRLAARDVKVVLTGEGSDEVFAGYSYLAAYDEPAVLEVELQRLIHNLHSLNLQRVDRMTMRNGLEARVPFLDLGFIRTAMEASPALKVRNSSRPAKWLLREACRDLLPPDLLWREKTQFDEGTGVADLMPVLARGRADFEKEAALAREAGAPPIRDAEEAWYFSLLRRRLDPARVVPTLGRWDTPPPGGAAEPRKAETADAPAG